MPFIRYHSIENHYYTKHICFKKVEFPDMAEGHFLIHEKLHGCNTQLILDLDTPMAVASRERVLDKNESFNDIWNTLNNYETPIASLKNWGEANEKNLNIYGELIGPGIGKGVKYNKEKEMRIFDIVANGELLPPAQVVRLLTNLQISAWYAPVVAVVRQLHMALSIKINTPTKMAPFEKDNIMEGVVIKPYFKTYIDGNGTPFMLKKKNIEFKEKEKAPKERKPLSSKIVLLNTSFKRFISQTRLDNIFSKWGEISAPNEISDYIKYMLEDAKEDWFKHQDKHILADLDKAERRAVFNVGSTIANMLKKYL